MKLAVAAGILAQTLPVVSEKAVDISSGLEKPFDLASILASIPREADESRPRGNTLRAHRGRRTQEGSSFQKQLQAKKNGLLLNKPTGTTRAEDAKPCDPSSNNADVGILSCGKGAYCEADETSFLGGKCSPRAVREGSRSSGKSKGLANFGNGGLLKNIREATKKASDGTVECDPSGSADVGVLSCGEGKQCIASAASSVGGFCAPEAHSRELYHLGYAPVLCDPSSYNYNYYDCDCSGFENTTGTGDITCTLFEDYCLGLNYAGCADTCASRTVEYNFVNSTAAGYSYCLRFSTPYAQTICIEEFSETESCAITFNDEPCTSCEVLPSGNYTFFSFDCENAGGRAGTNEDRVTDLLPIVDACFVGGPQPLCYLCPGTAYNYDFMYNVVDVPDLGEFTCKFLGLLSYEYYTISEEYCPVVSAAAAERCCSFYCELCGLGSEIPYANYDIELDASVPGFEGLTCYNISYAAYYSWSITEEMCPSAGMIAKTSCCEVPEITCDLCNVGDLDPTAAVPCLLLESLGETDCGIELPCILLESLGETDCGIVKPLVADICCVVPPQVAPTAAPVLVLGPATTDGGSGLLSTKGIASMMGLAVAAVAFVMN